MRSKKAGSGRWILLGMTVAAWVALAFPNPVLAMAEAEAPPEVPESAEQNDPAADAGVDEECFYLVDGKWIPCERGGVRKSKSTDENPPGDEI